MIMNSNFYVLAHRSTGVCLVNREYRVWRRRRLKKNHRRVAVTARNQLGDSFPFDLVTDFNSLGLIAPALGFASGLALYLSRLKLKRGELSDGEVSGAGEWILFTSPTPFNRFVVLRCPLISVEGSESEAVSEKLVKEDRHFVRLNSGRIQGRDGVLDEENKVIYQRKCVKTEDGGVISLDWPATLDFSEEHGLDTTIVIVPGTTEGSMDENVQLFVSECVRRGCFPIVMNPRGCSGSPVTTARLFTAADSDDVAVAIQFINRKRPWTTLVGVGWGYGANMLTKYLAEVGDNTPLTAATCVDNPFDLEVASRSLPYHRAVDQMLVEGLIDILKSNKELFQGQGKQFDVKSALQATCVRDFEKAISMISYGFDAIEDFYAKSSTQDVVDNVKIPVLFIQNEETVPIFSIPRSSIAGNPFTSLLLCSSPPSGLTASGRFTMSWCRHLTIEWLTAVELGLLKGRHPLVKDVDININPSKGLLTVEGQAPNKGGQVKKFPSLPHIDNVKLNGRSLKNGKHILGGSDVAAGLGLKNLRDSPRNYEDGHDGLQQENNDVNNRATSVDAGLVREDGVTPEESERGQALQTAEIIMNMLDKTMPDTLTEEKKQKVLTAVGQGESFMTALQGAVPEDVRDKLTNAASGILNRQRSNIKFDGLLNIGHGLNSKIQEKIGGISDAEVEVDDVHSLEQKNTVRDLVDNSDEDQSIMDISSGAPASESQDADSFQKSVDNDQLQTSDNGKEELITGKSIADELKSEIESAESSNEKDDQHAKQKENILDNNSGPELSVNTGMSSSTGDQTIDQSKLDQKNDNCNVDMKEDNSNQQSGENNVLSSSDQYKTSDEKTEETPATFSSEDNNNQQSGEKNVLSTSDQDKATSDEKMEEIPATFSSEDNNNQQSGEKNVLSTSDQDKATSDEKMEEIPAAFPSEAQSMEKEDTEKQREENIVPPVSDQNSASTPAFSVSEALNAFTGIDDSTQAAVNSVFNVIEDMINHLEEGRDDGTKVENGKESMDNGSDSVSEKNQTSNNKLGQNQENQHDLSLQIDRNASNDAKPNLVGQRPHVPTMYDENSIRRSRGTDSSSHVGREDGMSKHVVGTKLSAERSDKVISVEKVPRDIHQRITKIPYGNTLYGENLRKYLLSKMENSDSLDLDTTAALFLDYFPEEGQWKLLEQSGHGKDFVNDIGALDGIDNNGRSLISLKEKITDGIIEPSYVILDSEKLHGPSEEYKIGNSMNEIAEMCDATSKELMLNVKTVVQESLMVEVRRRLSSENIKEMEADLVSDLEYVSKAASLALRFGKDSISYIQSDDHTSKEVSTLLGEYVVRAISTAVQDTSYLRNVLPVGVVVGSTLASLRDYFHVPPASRNSHIDVTNKFNFYGVGHRVETVGREIVRLPSDNFDKNELEKPINYDKERDESNDVTNGTLMVGAVTAALGASALLVHQQDYKEDEISETSREVHHDLHIHEQKSSGKNGNNMVTSLAEKAMAVAGPVMPRRDGEVDQDRMVAMLAELGQRGGMLRLVGNAALLWGGIRGAMSLIDKLISFLRLSERPMFQRILGFGFLVLVLWTPIVVPLLPSIVQSWAVKSSAKFAELACIIGLYASIMTLITLWGKRIRGYENPFKQYGLDLSSSQTIQNFFYGLVGGVVLVLSIHSVSALLGYVHLSWPVNISTASDTLTQLIVYGQLLLLCGKGLVTATSITLVEELLFRSWLPTEIATDLGYHRGIIISGLAFSLSQRSPLAIPGLWLLSLSLSGARQRFKGSLFVPIGIRTGITASCFFLKTGGFLTYQPNVPIWWIGNNSFEPFSGIVGVAFALLLTVVLYPRQQPIPGEKLAKRIRE